MRSREIETIEEFDDVAATATSMAGWQVQGIDLTGREDVLARLPAEGSLFLGCALTGRSEDLLRAGGALLFPSLPEVPFDPWRSRLYTPAELYADLDRGYEATPDARVYAWFRGVQRPRGASSVRDALAMALHDNSIDDALDELVQGVPSGGSRGVVGVMGGHALSRDGSDYLAAARLGQELAAAGFVVATGGGPGAMEAANLGASLAEHDAQTLVDVVRAAARVPDFAGSVTAWARAGLAAVDGLSLSSRSLGVPTWFYGHEPPSPFACTVAKYFRNAVREAVLLHLCRAGIVFLPGAAGTVQEIFQAACENYYASPEDVAPMLLVGRGHWTRDLPAWPLLETLGRGRALGSRLEVLDEPEQVLATLTEEVGDR